MHLLKNIKFVTESFLFLVVFGIYCLGISDSINFWDSPEFITSNFTFQATHAPGAPLYTIFSGMVLAFFSAENAALISNAISAFFGAITVVMVFKITYFICFQILQKQLIRHVELYTILSGLLASLSLAFSTSFWTASIETEVYTMSFALFTVLVYTILLWHRAETTKTETKLMAIFFLVLGLSVGVHIILLATVVPFALVVVVKKYQLNIKTFVIGLGLGLLCFVILQNIWIGGMISIAAQIDIYAVNSLGFHVNFGALAFFMFVLVVLALIYKFSYPYAKGILKHFSLFLALFLLGTSSYVMPFLTADSNTLVAEQINSPLRLKDYIKAQRFGIAEIPVVYGSVYNAQLDNETPYLDADPVYTYDTEKKKYIISDDGHLKDANYSAKFKMLFPRMFDAKDKEKYKTWTTIKGETIKHKINDSLWTYTKPTFSENLSFFYNYQVYWLNLRYLYWNFIGRQNDLHGLGVMTNGNWMSGINAIDRHRVGESQAIPEYYKSNKSADFYYFIPFLMGLIGFLFLLKHKTYAWLIGLLFLIFGLGITIYVNPVPRSISIRERDYIFIGSFIMFTIWIGLSIPFLMLLVKKVTSKLKVHVIVCLIVFALVPFQLMAKGWDNHHNSGDDFAYRFGKSYLDACPEQAILITNGDNMTFPLWYLQQVEDYRTDVRVLNFNQLNIESHISNLKRPQQASLPVEFDLDKDLYQDGVERFIYYYNQSDKPLEIGNLTQFLNSDKTLAIINGRKRHYVPSNLFKLKIDSSAFPSLTSKSYDVQLMSSLIWKYPKKYYGLNEMVLYNIIENNINNRPICFANTEDDKFKVGLSPYLMNKGMVSQLVPLQRIAKNKNPRLVDTKNAYENLVKNTAFKPFDSESIHVKSENKSYAREILRKNYFYLAQALIEENQIEKAKKTIETCLELFPNEELPFNRLAFGLGTLCFRIGDTEKGNEIYRAAMHNMWEELQWITSINPQNPIINATYVKENLLMYQKMNKVMAKFNKELAITHQKNIDDFIAFYTRWYAENWPYEE